MKQILRQLVNTNYRYYEVWSYLYLMSDDGICHFTYLDICSKFKIPKSTLNRILAFQEKWNKKQLITKIEVTSIGHRVIFLQDLKEKQVPVPIITEKETVQPDPFIVRKTNDLLPWLRNYYASKDITYIDLDSDKKFIGYIWNKIERIMEHTDQPINSQLIEDNFKLFFENIPQFWLNNAFTLPTIFNKFTTIYTQIKNQNNGKSTEKSSSYKRAAQELNEDDYQFLTTRKPTVSGNALGNEKDS